MLKKILVITALLSLSTVAHAGPEDIKQVLFCNVSNFGMKTVTVFRNDITEQYSVQINDWLDEQPLSANDFDRGDIFLKKEGELNISLERREIAESTYDWNLTAKGDGTLDFYPASCE